MDSINFSWLLRITSFSILTFVPLLISLRAISATSRIYDQILLASLFTVILNMLIFRLNKSGLLIAVLVVLSIQNISAQVLMNVDRSRSLYIFGWVSDGNVNLKNGKINLSNVRSTEKVNQVAIENRINEQVARNLMMIENDGDVRLTISGRIVLLSAQISSRVFRLNGWSTNKS